jgi:hypothetical protein
MKKIWMYWMLVAVVAGACKKVNNLSDEAVVEQFTITDVQPANAQIGEVSIEEGKIRVELLPRAGLFPVTFKATAKVSHATADVVNFPAEFRFEAGASVEHFYAIAASGTPREYEVSLKAKDTGADILGFTLQNRVGDLVIIDPWNGAVRISAQRPHFPLDITATLVLSNGTTVRDTVITFADVDDKKTLAVQSKDGTTDRAWAISVEGPVQLANSDFERWINVGTNNVNIDPTPEKIWCTANNAFVQGTHPADHAGGKAAEMTTGIQNVPLLNHQLVTAGSLYTGYFTINIMKLDDPRSMTFFGVPHKHRISSVSFDARYVAGPQLQQSEKNAAGKYVVKNIDGHDNGEAWAEVLHWSKSEALQYHGSPIAGLTVLGRGRVVFDGADSRFHEWSNIVMPIDYTAETLAPTHIVIVFSSSKDGDLFKGASNSKLTVDNVVLNY